ncbi:MAG TPA: oligosaccharide flippase family protein [Kofleriaceae bacterium]|nr:oligosaccharide flippase family protein [Kofleriaceae bacterium]
MGESLTSRTIRGAAWTLSTTLGSRVVGLLGTLLLARYLTPAKYGEVMAAQIVTLIAFASTTFGVGIYLISNRDVTRAEVFHATCWFNAIGALALGLVWALSGPLGIWLEAPNLGDYMPWFVFALLLDRIAYVPERMLIRQLRFRWLSLAKAAGELVFTGMSLGLAAREFGAMSIVYASVARSTLRFCAIVPAVGWREWIEPHRLHVETLRKIIKTGVTISIAGIATLLQRRGDNLLVSVFFGNATMGAYNYAYNLADTPAVAIGEQLSDVVAAAFPHAEGAKRQTALVRACTMTSLIMFPLAFGLGAVAETVAKAFFDEKWRSEGLGQMLMLLSIVSAPRPMAHILHAYFFATQRIRMVLVQEWVSLALLMGAIATLGRLDIMWTCRAVGVAFVLRTLLLMWAVRRWDGIPLRRFLVPLIRPLLVCVAMVGVIALVRPMLGDLAPVLRLPIEIGLGAAIYLAGALLVFRDASREVIGMVRSSLSGRRGGGGGSDS